MRDFISSFLSLTEGAVSPHSFRLWTAVSLVAGALGRRVSARTGKGHVYPNMYILLVGPPGAGKSIVESAKELWSGTKTPDSKGSAFRVASNSITSASLIDELAKAKFIRVMPSGPPYVCHQLIIAAEELQVLLPGYDTTIIGKLNEIYNNSAVPYSESRRTGTVRELVIENPNLNILAGAQPAYFASTFPEEVWSTGFARRVLMVYSDEIQLNSLWFEPEVDETLKPWMCSALARMSELMGVVKWTPAAATKLDDWHMGGGMPIPAHSKLAQYVRNRSVNLIKLSLISAVSRTGELVIEELDVSRALEWMLSAEKRMPDIFRAMIGKSDMAVLEEMHYFVTSIWAKNKKPVNVGQIMRFLLHRVPSEKAEKILQQAERANILARVAGTQDLYLPRPKAEHEESE